MSNMQNRGSVGDLAAFRCLANERACMYVDARNLLQLADSLYLHAKTFDDRVREFEEIEELEMQDFVSIGAVKLLGAGARILGPNGSLEILIEVCGYEKILLALKDYEENNPPKKVE